MHHDTNGQTPQHTQMTQKMTGKYVKKASSELSSTTTTLPGSTLEDMPELVVGASGSVLEEVSIFILDDVFGLEVDSSSESRVDAIFESEVDVIFESGIDVIFESGVDVISESSIDGVSSPGD